MPYPALERESRAFQAFEPHAPPPLSDRFGVGGRGEDDGQRRSPLHAIREQAPAHVVDVVVEAIVGRAHRDDRSERPRAPDRRLQAGGPAPRRAHHAHGAVAPGLRRNPLDDLRRVVQLLGPIHVGHQALGVAGAPHVDPHAGVAVTREEGVVALVADAHHVAFPVRDVLEHGRGRLPCRCLRQPQARRKANSVANRYPAMLDFPDPGQ